MAQSREEYNSYMRSYMKRRYRRRREEAVNALGGKCVACGSLEDLQFDHIDAGSKEFSVGSRLASAPSSVLALEMKKCQLLCMPCHIDKTEICGDVDQTGSANSQSKLTENDVREARERWSRGSRTDGTAALAREYGVSKTTMSMALKRQTWKHV